MFTFKRTSIAFAFAVVSAFSHVTSASATGLTGTAADFGMPADSAGAMRSISIDATTKWVNVTNGEIVRFVANGQTFTWHFDTFQNATSFDLARIAPADAMVGKVRAFVAANPLYQN